MNNDKLREALRRFTVLYYPGEEKKRAALFDGLCSEVLLLFPAPEPVDDKALAEAIARLDAGDTSCLITDSVEVLAALRAAQQEVKESHLAIEALYKQAHESCEFYDSNEFSMDMEISAALGILQQEVAELRRRNQAYADVDKRRDTQNAKWGVQNHDPITWSAILTEECGEFAQAALHNKFGGSHANGLRDEVIDCAAVAVQIIEYLDRAAGEGKGAT